MAKRRAAERPNKSFWYLSQKIVSVGFTQTSLAEKLGVPQPTCNAVCTGHRKSIPLQKRIAALVKSRVEDLFSANVRLDNRATKKQN